MKIEIGDRVKVVLPGVPEWKLPEQTREGTATEENLEAIRDDVAEQRLMGNARVWINGKEQ